MDEDRIPDLPTGPDEAPAWLTRVIGWAAGRRATDLHFFPGEADAALWVRVDGELREAARYGLAIHERLVARLKVMGRCTDYSGEPIQEGRFQLNGRACGGEARLSVLPTLRGDKAVVRLIGGGQAPLRLEDLGFGEPLVARLRAAMDCPQGLILAIGPAGCGKSTTLYALLDDLAARSGGPVSILTIEDPVERSLPAAAQIAADPARGLTFAAGLRALLRQDPEVIMIGEIRDAETATTALQAALTGHRLLSSMHTLTPAEALVRLRQMGAPAYVIASALAGIVNVRLARLLCTHCRAPHEPTPEERALFPELQSLSTQHSALVFPTPPGVSTASVWAAAAAPAWASGSSRRSPPPRRWPRPKPPRRSPPRFGRASARAAVSSNACVPAKSPPPKSPAWPASSACRRSGRNRHETDRVLNARNGLPGAFRADVRDRVVGGRWQCYRCPARPRGPRVIVFAPRVDGAGNHFAHIRLYGVCHVPDIQAPGNVFAAPVAQDQAARRREGAAVILPFPNLFLFRVLRILAVMACVVACTVVALDFLSPDPQFRMHGGIYNPLDIFRDFGLGLAGIFLLVFMVVAMMSFPKYRRLGMFWPRLLPKIDPHPGRHS